MIQIKRKADGNMLIISGHIRLMAEMRQSGYASVVEVTNHETMHVFDVGDRVLVLTEKALERVKREASDVIDKASRH